MIFDFFLAQDKKLTLEDLTAHFSGTSATELFPLVNGLVAKKLLNEDPLQFAWGLSDQAKSLREANPQSIKYHQPLPSKKPAEHLYTGLVAWLAIILAFVLALLALVVFLMKVE